MSRTVVIAHLYPREMNIYGDMGNIITLAKRLEWRGYRVQVKPVEVGEKFDFDEVDVVFGGGGQDSGQSAVAADLVKRGEALRAMAADGVPMLTICGLYQLFGHEFVTVDGEKLPGIDVFNTTTLGGKTRMIGNIVVETEQFGKLVGFENHSGQTILDEGQEALGRVLKGHGNDLKSGREGAVAKAAVGTYMHGPVLPKNPRLADYLLLEALKRRHGVTELEPMDDVIEQEAAKVAMGRPQ
jgi:lipid II isoglutaminyl synthase (glutamine-hydrolysing)